LGTCLDWKNKHYAELRALIGQRNIIALNSSETDLKQIISLNKELTTTPIVENSEQEKGEAIENGNFTPLATDIANISIQMKNINDRFDQISTESKQFKEINSELENQIAQLKACLKIEQQNCKSLQDEIVIKDKKIKIQQDEISSNNSNQVINEARSKNYYNINKSIKFVYEWYFVNLNSGI
jgi:uncharacterized protein (DUF3084 family)